MNAAGQYRVVMVTCGTVVEAQRIARSVVDKRLAACANIVRGVESIYRWKDKVEQAPEILVIIKTSARRLRELEREVQRVHSYDVPEFIVLPMAAGSRRYLSWISESVAARRKTNE